MLYCQFIRSILEFNSCVWYSSITEEECEDLDRVQKNACKLILKEEYKEYKSALTVLGLDCLRVRREKLALKFAKKCLELPTMQDFFPRNQNDDYMFRNKEKYSVNFAYTKKCFKSSIPSEDFEQTGLK